MSLALMVAVQWTKWNDIKAELVAMWEVTRAMPNFASVTG